GMLVEVAMVGGALNLAAEQVIENSAYGALLERRGNRGPVSAPQGLYLAADVDAAGKQDRWVAIAVETDAQWQALREVVGVPAWAADPALDSIGGRRAAHDTIDRELASWCATLDADAIVSGLWSAGVPVAKVIMPHEQKDLPQIVSRRFFEPLRHPVTGEYLQTGYPVRFSSGPERLQRAPAPCLGQHNREILVDLLGVSEAELAELEASGVIGNRVGGGTAW
ncbi:MAG: CoA transferase, partial [Candidatus Binatia bacterium]